MIDAAEALNQAALTMVPAKIQHPHASTVRRRGAHTRPPSHLGGRSAAYFVPDKDDPYLRVLSDFVIGRAIDDWRDFVAQHRGVGIAINLPINFFQDPSLVSVCAVGCPITRHSKGSSLRLTPLRMPLCDLDLAEHVARQLRFSNIAISIDNLGSEWPLPLELHDFPFVEIKEVY